MKKIVKVIRVPEKHSVKYRSVDHWERFVIGMVLIIMLLDEIEKVF